MLPCNHQYLPKMNSMLRPGPWAWAWAEAAARRVSWCPRGRLRDVDREVWSLVYHEKERQRCALELAPSENFCSRAVQECLGSCLSNKLSVRKPSKGPPGGAVVQPVEQLCQRRALEAFGLDNARWGVDVRLHSGAAARAAALTALLRPHERFMAPEAPAVKEASDSSPLSAVGGDDEAGARTPGPTTPRHALGLGAATGGLFEVVAYPMDPRSGLVDYEALTKLAQSFRPRVILARAASSPRLLDLIRFRSVCDHVGAILLTDYAQEAGLVAARVIPGPFEQSDVVTAACHHTLRGPRCGLLFYRRSGPAGNIMERLESERVRQRCTPHNNVIAAAAVALREAQHDFFFEYQQQVVNNAKAMSLALTKLGHLVRTTGTDTHLVLLDLSGRGMSSHQAAIACDVCGIAVARGRLGLRLGTAALTSRGLQPAHFSDAAFLLDRALHLGARAAAGLKPGVSIEKVLNTTPLVEEARKIKEEVIRFIERFPMPGFENT